jgi:hypothetical protein
MIEDRLRLRRGEPADQIKVPRLTCYAVEPDAAIRPPASNLATAPTKIIGSA